MDTKINQSLNMCGDRHKILPLNRTQSNFQQLGIEDCMRAIDYDVQMNTQMNLTKGGMIC